MSMKFREDDRFSLRDDLVVEEVDDEVIVLDLAGNKYFGLNDVGWLIWQALDEAEKDLGTLAEEISSRFEIPLEQSRSDAEAFIAQLIEAGLASRFLDEAGP